MLAGFPDQILTHLFLNNLPSDSRSSTGAAWLQFSVFLLEEGKANPTQLFNERVAVMDPFVFYFSSERRREGIKRGKREGVCVRLWGVDEENVW